MKPRIHLSTLCLLVAVVALTIALFLLTARHNRQLQAMTAQFNAQLADEANRHDLQRVNQALEFDWKLTDLTYKDDAQLAAKRRAATASPRP